MISYFAYGSNLDQNQMRKRCPESNLVGKFVLKNYRLGFTIFSSAAHRQCGCADVIKSDEDEVWGLVYEISDSDLISLDKYEGHPRFYKRFTTKVYDEFNHERVVESYEVIEKNPKHQEPSQDYFNIISNAVEKWDFPESYKNFLRSIKIKSI